MAQRGAKEGSNAVVRIPGPIDLFFRRYNQFDYDPHGEAWAEYRRMTGFFHWKKDSEKERKANNLFREAVVAEFGALYGASEDKLDTLQRLCGKLEISPLPQSITACKKAIEKVHVNIMDFIDCERTGNAVHKFPSVNQLRKYTTAHDKFFPRKQAKKSFLLRYLLRRLM
ncbi:hypothetical protein E4U41_006513 [Claviceps citrina]|nr:hypothetical protein E4U41_006513 [Claviceps citrina]